MKKISRHIGAAGVVLTLLGVLGYGMASKFMGFWVIPWTLAVICFVIFGTYNPNRIKAFFSSRTARYGASNFVVIGLVAGILIFAALLTKNHSIRYDLTENKKFSLAPQTVKILEGLDREIEVQGFFQGEGAMKMQGRELFKLYSRISDKFTYEILDPDRNPGKANAAGITAYDQVVVRTGEQKERISKLSEEALTNAILHVTKPDKKRIYFLKGHGEKDIADGENNGYSLAKSELESTNFEVLPLFLPTAKTVPDDAKAVVVAGPVNDLLPEELDALDKYMRSGGNALIMIDPEQGEQFVKMMTKFGVVIGENIILDDQDRLPQGSPLMPITYRYYDHPIMKDFKLPTAFPLVRSVEKAEKDVEGVEVVPLIFTGENSYVESDVPRLLKDGQLQKGGEGDRNGPVSVAVVGTVKVEKSEDAPESGDSPDKKEPEPGRLLVIGDSEFAANQFLPVFGNRDFFMNAVSWLAQETDQIAIRPKERKNEPLILNQMQARLALWVPVVLVPLAVLVAAFLILSFKRRER